MVEDEDKNEDYTYDILGDNYLNLEENPIKETDIDKYKEKVKRSGIIYISYIPDNMKVLDVKDKN